MPKPDQKSEKARKARVLNKHRLKAENRDVRTSSKVVTVKAEPWSGAACEGTKAKPCAGKVRTVKSICEPCKDWLEAHHGYRRNAANIYYAGKA
jgi:hypothetical protein